MTYPFTEHTFESVNAYWFDAPRQPPLVLLKDAPAANPYLFRGQINRHRDFLALYFTQRGRGLHLVNGEPNTLARGDVYLLGMGSAHQYLNCADVEVDALYFPLTIFDAETLRILRQQPTLTAFLGEGDKKPFGKRWKHLSPVQFEEINAELAVLKREWSSGTELSRIATLATFLRLLVTLARQEDAFARSDAATLAAAGSDEAVNLAIHLIETRFTNPVRIEEIAAAVAMSPDWLTRLFREVTGTTPRDYLSHLRLECAKALLITSSHTVSEVALLSGFNNAAYFARFFRKRTGFSPRNFKSVRDNQRTRNVR